jgi:hypothetical protein
MSKKRVGRKAVPKEAAVSESDSREPLIELSEEEQWRLINESGILNKAGVSDKPTVPLAVPESDFADEVFNAILLIIPFSFALLLMEMYASSSFTVKEATAHGKVKFNSSTIWTRTNSRGSY